MSYGLELTAETGFKFIIPQHQGFVFNKYIDIPLNANQTVVSHVITGVPAGEKCMIFARHLSGDIPIYVPHIALNDLGDRFSIDILWPSFPSASAYSATYRVYVFTSYEVNSPGGYGIQVFNDKGTLTYGTNTKPLKIHEGSYQVNTDVSVSFTAAVAPILLGVIPQRYQGPTGFWTQIGNATIVATGNSIVSRRNFVQVVPAEIYPSSVANSSYLYINAADYD